MRPGSFLDEKMLQPLGNLTKTILLFRLLLHQWSQEVRKVVLS